MPTPLDPTVRGDSAQNLMDDLKHMVIGQPEAIESVVDMYQMQQAGLCSPGRPLGSFLFLGPTGTGKTRLVESLSHLIFGDPLAKIKIDCAEFQHGHEIAKLIGSPPGYLGHRETHPMLSQPILNKYHTERCKLSFVLFDEIEKASDTLWNLLLGILDKGTLTLGDNSRVDFSRSVVFLTSNLGSKELAHSMQEGLGFSPAPKPTTVKKGKVGLEAARRKFTPEFINRLDRIITFNALGEEDLRQVLEIEISLVQQRIMAAAVLNVEAPRFMISVATPVKEFLIAQGLDPRYGARHLKRSVEKNLMHPMVNLVTSGQILEGDVITIDLVDDKLQFFREKALAAC